MTQRVRHKVHFGYLVDTACGIPWAESDKNNTIAIWFDCADDWKYVTCKKCLAKRTMRHSKLGGKRDIF